MAGESDFVVLTGRGSVCYNECMILTIGHSTLSQDDFVEAVKAASVDVVWDIRSHPTSKWPWFWKQQMEKWLPENGVGYHWEPGLGGWDVRHANLIDEFKPKSVDVAAYTKGKFPKQIIASDRNKDDKQTLFWTSRGLYDYSWFTTLDEFVQAANKLIEDSKNTNIAIMCAEAVPWRCHRSMVSDYLAFHGVESYHIMNAKGKLLLHSKMLGNRLERYESEIVNTWRSSAR